MSATDTKKIDGELSIHTENIFPIIKKWLYSEKEIFVRELTSNAHDAISKLQKLSVTENLDSVPESYKIQISVDEKKKTITFSDNGIGMDADDIQKYINQIAFSGATEFVEKFKDEDEKSQLIGHFGLGFYSAFIVSEKVEIQSLSYRKGATPAKWTCDGSTHFTIEDGNRTEVGTDIILYVSKEEKEYASETKIKELVQKYANFLPVEIQVNGEKVNDQAPLWVKQPKDVKDEEYKEFYQKLFPFNPEPLFWIHLNVDYPFNLKGILYFPKVLHEHDSRKGQVKLFCQQVFVSDNLKEVIPDFLMLLQGAIDCPEIPLNVSRSYLQNDPYVMKISNHIIKKVADKLNQLFKKERESFDQYWEDIHTFIKYGMMNNDKFYEKVKDIVIFSSSNDTTTTVPEYLERNKSISENTVLYATDKDAQASHIAMCKDHGLETLFLTSIIDSHFLNFLESRDQEVKYVSVDSEISEHLIEKDENASDDTPSPESEKVVELFKKALGDDTVKVEAKALKSEDVSAILTEPEHVKRLKNMSALMPNSGPAFNDHTLVLNTNSPVVKNVLKIESKVGDDELNAICAQILDLARISSKQLSGEEVQEFIKRSNKLLVTLSSKL